MWLPADSYLPAATGQPVPVLPHSPEVAACGLRLDQSVTTMTAASIKHRRKLLDEKLRQAHAAVRVAQGQIQALEMECDHSSTFRTSHTGESCVHCRDCGKCGV